jgi:uncharacterized membrane protein
MYSHDEAYTSLHVSGHSKFEVVTFLRDGNDHLIREVQQFLSPADAKTVFDTLNITVRAEPQQAPLYYIMAHYWMRITSYTPAAMRALTAIISLFSIPAMYWFSKELFQSSRGAILSMALYAISPFHILYAQDARAYSILALAVIISCAAFLRAMRKNNLSSWFLYSLSIILGIYSNFLFILIMFVHVFFIIVIILFYRRKAFLGFFYSYLLALFVFVPWIYVVSPYQESAAETLNWVNARVHWIQYPQRWAMIFSSPFLDFDLSSGNLIPYLLRAVALALIAYSFLFLWRRGLPHVKLFLLPLFFINAGAFIVPDLILGGIRSIGGRYFIPSNIALVMIVSYFLISGLNHSNPYTLVRWKLMISVLLAASILSNVNILLTETWWSKELGRIRPEFIHEINQDKTLLIVSSGQHGTTFGDILLLGLEVDADVHLRWPDHPEDIQYASSYEHIYWFANSPQEVQEISEKNGLQVREVLTNTLWQIEGEKSP